MRNAIVCCLFASLFAGTAQAQDDVAAFYKGKTVRMMVATAPGSGVDLIGRLVARHVTHHIPGNPNIVVQNAPGAGGLQMANAMYNTAPRDGTVMGASLNGMPYAPLLQPKAARFDPTKLIWIGSMYRSNNVAFVWHTAPVQTLEQLRTQDLLVGTAGPGSGSYDLSMLSREVLGLRFKVVRGYEGSNAINIAMERGEIEAQIVGWDSLMAGRPNWLRDKLITIIGHYSLEDPPELRPYARIADLAKTEADKQALALMLARQAHGRPYFLPPDVPAPRVTALRRAFDATMTDPAFVADAQAMKVDISPMTGEDVQALIARVHNTTPPEVVERVRNIMDGVAN